MTQRLPECRSEVLADGWYGALIDSFQAFERLLERWPYGVQVAAWKLGFARGVVLFVVGLRFDRIAVTRADMGWRTLLLLRVLLGRRRKLIALQFIDHPGAGRRVWRVVERWALR